MADRREQKRRKIEYTDAKKTAEERDAGFQSQAIKIPNNLKQFKFKKSGIYRLDILPFVAGEHNPHAAPGKAHWERTYWVHRGVGINNDVFCCLRRTFGKACPICEEVTRLKRNPSSDPDAIKELYEKERQMFVVFDHADRDAGYQIFENSYNKGLGELIDAKLKGSEEGEDDYRNFFHLEGGLTLKITVDEDTFNGRTFYKPINLEMVRRKEDFDESVLDDTPCLDEIPVEVSYDKLKKAFLQEGDEEEETARNGTHKGPKTKPAKAEEPDEDEEDEEEEEASEDDDDIATAKSLGITLGMEVEHPEFGVCTVVHISGDGTSLRLKDEDGATHLGIAPDTLTLIEEKPAKKGAAKPEAKAKSSKSQPPSKGKRSDPDPDDDEDEDLDDDEDSDEEEKEEDSDEDDLDDLDDDEDEPKAKKKPAAKPARKGR